MFGERSSQACSNRRPQLWRVRGVVIGLRVVSGLVEWGAGRKKAIDV